MLLTTGTVLGVSIASPAMAKASAAVATWNMDETSGSTMVDSSGNGNDGSISSKVDLGQPGVSGKAYGFNGDGGLVNVPNSSSLSESGSAYSVSLSFKSSTKPSSSVGDYDLIRKGLGTTSGGDWKIEVLRKGVVFCHFRGASRTVDITGSKNVVDGSFHTLTCKYSSSGAELLIDGKSQKKSSKVPGNIKNSSSLSVGAKNSHDDETTGVIDSVSITKG